MYYRKLGYRGYFGVDFYNEENNKRLSQANILIDVYNSKINTFETKEENDAFAKSIDKDINTILKGEN